MLFIDPSVVLVQVLTLGTVFRAQRLDALGASINAGIMRVCGGVLAALWLGVQADAAAAGRLLRYSAQSGKKKAECSDGSASDCAARTARAARGCR